MITQHARLTQVCEAKLKAIKLADRCSVEITGPCLVLAPDPNWAGSGPPPSAPQVGWYVTVTLLHDKLIGQPPIVAALPMGGVLPPDLMFEQAVQVLLDGMRNVRAQANNPLQAQADQMNAEIANAKMRGQKP